MELRVKFLELSAGVPIVMLNTKTAEKIGVHARDRVLIKPISKKSRELLAITDLVKKMVHEDEIGVSSEVKEKMRIKKGQKVRVSLSDAPESLSFIKKKLDGHALSEKEIMSIIKDVVSNSLSEAEIALFVSAMYQKGTSMEETVYLIKAILNTGKRVDLKNKLIVDKHSIGGIAGRITPIVVSICASAGLIMPKTSSRAITTPAGTADALETLARVDFTIEELKKLIAKVGACIVWGGGLGIVPADSKLIQVEKQLSIDPEAQLLASIFAKKLSVGSNCILIHIPYGKTAKVTKDEALRLKRKFEYLGKYFKRQVKCILTKNNGPIGNGIGPSLEMVDVIKVLKRESSCYLLEKNSLEIAGALLEMTKKAKKGHGFELAKKILDSKKAFEKFKEIIKAQHGSLENIREAKFKKDIFTNKSGKILEIDNKQINYFARLAGCPVDKFAGIYLYFHPNDKVNKGDKILTVYSESKSRLNQAIDFYKKYNPIIIK